LPRKDEGKARRSHRLCGLIHRGFESKDLDYKGPILWDESDKPACCELVKDVLALANTKGGFIVIGVSEKEEGFEPVGLNEDQLASFETTRFNTFLQNYVDPPINTTLLKVICDGGYFVIIKVPPFPNIPHICVKPYPGVLSAPTIYVRTDNNESAPIKHSADLQAVIEQAVRNREDRMIKSIRSILKTGSSLPETRRRKGFETQFKEAIETFDRKTPLKDKGYQGYREASLFPQRFIRYKLSLAELKPALDKVGLDFKGSSFITTTPETTYFFQEGIEHSKYYQALIDGLPRLIFFRLYQSGFFYHRKLMWEEVVAGEDKSSPFLSVESTIKYIVSAIYAMVRLYDYLNLEEEPIVFHSRLLGTSERKLIFLDSSFAEADYRCRISKIVVERTYPLSEWRAGIEDHAVEMMKEVALKFNWEEPDLDYFHGRAGELLEQLE
jgi:hypothetical protein